MQSGHRNALECIAALSATDFRKDPDMFDVPALVIHGDDDRVVPVSVGGQAPAAVIKNVTLKVYPGAQRGMTEMHEEQPDADLLEVLNA
jgi:non-heme chloroperoxidase